MAGSDLHTELAARMPWTVAAPGSWWLITATIRDPRAPMAELLRDCVAWCVEGDYPTPVFAVPTASGTRRLLASQIDRARELILVRADDPLTAAYPWEQDAIDAALSRRDEETR